jgi:hypothetical protein
METLGQCGVRMGKMGVHGYLAQPNTATVWWLTE